MTPLNHPRLLTPFCWHSTPKYRGVLTADCTVDLRKGWRGQHEIDIGNGLVVRIDDDRLTMPKGYASDLASPAVKVFGKWIGTPSGFREALAAFVHDVLRQLLNYCLPCLRHLTRKTTDDLFFDFLHEAKSGWFRIYHRAVSGPVGSVFMWLTAKPSVAICKFHKDANASQNQVAYLP